MLLERRGILFYESSNFLFSHSLVLVFIIMVNCEMVIEIQITMEFVSLMFELYEETYIWGREINMDI